MDKLNAQNFTNKIHINNRNIRTKLNTVNNKSFDEVLSNIKKNNKLKFSKHAEQRLYERNITLSDYQVTKLEDAILKAENKGVKEALILLGDTAFIASIKNNTIITTATAEQLKENVFTNIDGAVII